LQQDEQDPLLQAFGQLKQRLSTVSGMTASLIILMLSDVADMDVTEFLSPFLAVIQSDITTGVITGVALSSVHKFLSFGLIGVA
jgi:brefeldin A-resistance guanine nucleotide exchange factor 1